MVWLEDALASIVLVLLKYGQDGMKLPFHILKCLLIRHSKLGQQSYQHIWRRAFTSSGKHTLTAIITLSNATVAVFNGGNIPALPFIPLRTVLNPSYAMPPDSRASYDDWWDWASPLASLGAFPSPEVGSWLEFATWHSRSIVWSWELVGATMSSLSAVWVDTTAGVGGGILWESPPTVWRVFDRGGSWEVIASSEATTQAGSADRVIRDLVVSLWESVGRVQEVSAAWLDSTAGAGVKVERVSLLMPWGVLPSFDLHWKDIWRLWMLYLCEMSNCLITDDTKNVRHQASVNAVTQTTALPLPHNDTMWPLAGVSSAVLSVNRQP